MDQEPLVFNQILWLNFLFPRFPCPGSFQKMHNLYIQRAHKSYQSLPDRTCQTKDSKVELWINWRKQENSTPWVGRAFGNILLLEGLPAVSTCCREPFAFHIGREHSKFIFFLALLDIFEQNFGRQKRRGGRCQSKPLIIPSLKLTMGLINTKGGED